MPEGFNHIAKCSLRYVLNWRLSGRANAPCQSQQANRRKPHVGEEVTRIQHLWRDRPARNTVQCEQHRKVTCAQDEIKYGFAKGNVFE